MFIYLSAMCSRSVCLLNIGRSSTLGSQWSCLWAPRPDITCWLSRRKTPSSLLWTPLFCPLVVVVVDVVVVVVVLTCENIYVHLAL